MHHIAIMKKSFGFIDRILSKEKMIESRWYNSRIAPWDKVKKGDTVFFKNAGEKVTTSASVSKVLQFSKLTPINVKGILIKYKERLGIRQEEYEDFHLSVKEKKYCILIFLKNPRLVAPFNINKSGYGAMTAWMCVENIDSIILN